MDVSRTVTEVHKIWLAMGGVGLIVVWHYLPRKIAMRALIVLTLLAGMNYARWGSRIAFTNQVDVYDVVHYYLNAKYFEELGYYDLYPACILADHENDGPYFEEGTRYLAQDEAGHHMRPISHALARGREVRDENFTPESWAAFEHDFLKLQRGMRGWNDQLWRQMIQDHGFNGTPAWVLVAKPFATLVPVEGVKYLCWIDLLLLAAAIFSVRWAYGDGPALWTLFFLFVSYSLRWPTVTWGFLRYDWVAAMIFATVLLSKGKHGWAGVAAGYTASIRMFPALWMLGPFAKGVAGLVRKQVHRPLLVFLGGFLIGVGVLYGGAVVAFGPEHPTVHLENMLDHNKSEQLSSRRIGFALGLAYDGKRLPKNIPKERKQTIENQKPIRYGAALVVLLLLGFALRNEEDDEAYAFGFVPFFLLTTASYYYYVARVTLALIHAKDLARERNRFGLAWLFGLELFSNFAETAFPKHRVLLIGWLAWGLTAYVFVMTAWILRDSLAKTATATATDGEGVPADATSDGDVPVLTPSAESAESPAPTVEEG